MPWPLLNPKRGGGSKVEGQPGLQPSDSGHHGECWRSCWGGAGDHYACFRPREPEGTSGCPGAMHSSQLEMVTLRGRTACGRPECAVVLSTDVQLRQPGGEFQLCHSAWYLASESQRPLGGFDNVDTYLMEDSVAEGSKPKLSLACDTGRT